MPQPIRVQLLTISHILTKIVGLSADLTNNLLTINRLLLEIEFYLDQLRTQRLSRKARVMINKFEKAFKELKIYLFLKPDLVSFKEEALSWANILDKI